MNFNNCLSSKRKITLPRRYPCKSKITCAFQSNGVSNEVIGILLRCGYDAVNSGRTEIVLLM